MLMPGVMQKSCSQRTRFISRWLFLANSAVIDTESFSEEALSPEDIDAFREAMHYSMPIGSDYFRMQIERKLERSLGYMGRGRPRFGLVKK